MHRADSGEPVIHPVREPRPRETVPLAAPSKRSHPDVLDEASEPPKAFQVLHDGVVVEVATQHALKPPTSLGRSPVPVLHQVLLDSEEHHAHSRCHRLPPDDEHAIERSRTRVSIAGRTGRTAAGRHPWRQGSVHKHTVARRSRYVEERTRLRDPRGVKVREFEAAVRAALSQVPLETRRGWDGNDLFGWWMQTSQARPDLVEDRYKGDPWQRVHGICLHARMFGEDALQ